MPVWARALPWDILNKVGKEHKIDVWLLGCICYCESLGDSNAVRFEPKWRYFYHCEEYAKENRITKATETFLQASSWGLLQIMGSVARELGYTGPLNALNDPYLGAYWGGLKLKSFLKLYDTEDAIASYNAGSPRRLENGEYTNQGYVNKVLDCYNAKKGLQ